MVACLYFGNPLLIRAAGSCPKILMFDGLGYTQEAYSEAKARYWGQEIGVQGFFLNYVMGGWANSVGDDETSPVYQRIKNFQETFSKFGVTDNFIKVASRLSLDWSKPEAMSKVATNFGQAAHLAKFAGLKGVALDLEPQVDGLWTVDPAIPDKPEKAFSLGKQVGAAIKSEYPGATVIVLPEVLLYVDPARDVEASKKYALSTRFWDGLAQTHFSQLIIATELTYNSWRPDLIVGQVRDAYRDDLIKNGLNPKEVPIAPGIWPLGKTYTDKTPRVTPWVFRERLGRAFRTAREDGSPYVWIYGFGSAWETDGPYGKGSVTPQLQDYVNVLEQVKNSCSNSS